MGPLAIKQHRDPRLPWCPGAISAVEIRDIQQRLSERIFLGCMTLDFLCSGFRGMGVVLVGIMLKGCPIADIINSISAPHIRTHNENS